MSAECYKKSLCRVCEFRLEMHSQQHTIVGALLSKNRAGNYLSALKENM